MFRPLPPNALLGLLVAGLCGCSYSHGPGSTDLVDGSYRGRPTLATSTPDICPGTHYGYIEVGDRDLHFAYLPNVVFDAPVGSEGSLHSTSGDSVLDGKITDDQLVFSVTTPQCHSSYNLRFLWNHS